MRNMKKTVLAAVLVLGIAVAPASFAQDGAQPFGGLFAPLGDWLQSIWESFAPAVSTADAGAGDGSEFMGYTVPGG